MSAVEQLAAALEEVEAGQSRSAAVSLTLPAPLVAALRALVDEGMIPSASAAVSEGLRHWAHNRLLRDALDQTYRSTPEARPTEAEVAAAARRLGLAR